MANDLQLSDFDLEAELAAVRKEQEEEAAAKRRANQGVQDQEPPPDADGDAAAAAPEEPGTPAAPTSAPASRVQSAASSKPVSARPRSSVKVHPTPDPAPLHSDFDLERGVAAAADGSAPEWANKWLSDHNKAAKLNAFQQYIERVQDQGEGPVSCPSAEERHATGYWITSRFLLDRFSAHGVAHVVRHPGPWRRLFWALVVLGSLVMLVLQVWGTLNEFLSFPKKVTIELLEDKEPEFPAVTICNFNVLSSDKMKGVKKYEEIIEIEEEIASIKMDCDAYQEGFNTYYSENDIYNYEEVWGYGSVWDPATFGETPAYGSGMDPAFPSPDFSGHGGPGYEPGMPSGYPSLESSGFGIPGFEPGIPIYDPFAEYSGDGSGDSDSGPFTGESDGMSAANPTFDTSDEETAVTWAVADETSRRKRREARGPSRLASPARERSASATVQRRGVGGRSVGTGPDGPGASADPQREARGRQERAGPGQGRRPGARQPRPVSAGGSTGGHGPEKVRRRRYIDPGNYSYEDEDYYPIGGNIFYVLGGNNTYRDLVRVLKQGHTDPAIMQRAFTPTVEEIQQFGIKSAQFITSCTLNNVKCSHRDFLQWQSEEYGNCFTFNSGFRFVRDEDNRPFHIEPNKTRTFGSKSGLRVTLNVDASRYASMLTPDVGVRVLVHPSDQLPFPEERGFSVVPGFTTVVGISRKRIRRVGHPHGKCRESEDFIDGHKSRYTATACRKRCVEDAIRTECHCTESVNRYLVRGLTRDLERCNPLVNATADRCRQQVKAQFTSGDSTCDCPPPCLEDRFEKSLSMNLPNKDYYKIMRNFTDDFTGADLCESSQLSNSTLRLQVYLEDFSYEYIHESPAYSVEALISNIGGLMGICLGLSALTLVEFFEFLMELMVNGWRNCQNRDERAATRSGIKKVEVLPSDPKTGMQCVTIIHTFERPPPHIVEQPPPPKPPQTESEVQTKVSLTFFEKRRRRTKKTDDSKKGTTKKRLHKRR